MSLTKKTLESLKEGERVHKPSSQHYVWVKGVYRIQEEGFLEGWSFLKHNDQLDIAFARKIPELEEEGYEFYDPNDPQTKAYIEMVKGKISAGETEITPEDLAKVGLEG